jgi:hypothetical protein
MPQSIRQGGLAVVLGLGLLSLGGGPRPLAGQADDGTVTLKTVKYTELGDIVRKLKGKVVVVDFWADY